VIRACVQQLCDCPGADAPVLNISSEAPDPLLFYGVGWSQYNPYVFPPLGNDTLYVAQDCFNISYSAISQALADLMAANNAALCVNPPGPGTDPPFPPWPPQPPFPDFTWTPPVFVPPDPNYQQFVNERQVATASCPNGAIFSYAIEAGTLISIPIPPSLGPIMVELLNSHALAVALQQVWALRICIDVTYTLTIYDPITDTSTTYPDTPTSYLRVPAGATSSDVPTWWPTNTPYPPTPTSTPPMAPPRGPTIADNAGWMCLGGTLIPQVNTYSVSQPGPFTFSISGNVPPGTSLVTLNANHAQLQGSPSAPGMYIYTIKAVNTANPSLSVEVTDELNVLGITSAAPPDGTDGTAYGPVQLTTAGGSGTVVFDLDGSLPDGLTLTTTGIVSGTPTADGIFDFTVNFTDSDGSACAQDMTIEVVSHPPIDWNLLGWSNFFIGGAHATGAAAGDSVTAFDVLGDMVGSAFATFTGTMTFTGAASNCQIAVEFTSLTGALPNYFGYDLIQQDGVTITQQFFLANITGPGIYLFPFTVAAGTLSAIEVGLHMIGQFGGSGCTGSAVLSVIP